MNLSPALRTPLLLVPLLALLAACGGGGGGGGGGSSNPPGPMVTVSGRVTYQRIPPDPATDGLNYASVLQEPARAVTVQAIRNSNQGVLASVATDANGNYSLPVPASTSVFIRVRAEMVRSGTAPTWDFRVLDNTRSNALYTLAGSVFDTGTTDVTRNLNAPSGFDGTGNVSGARSAGPFAILDSVYQAYNKVLSVDPTAVFPRLEIGWSISNQPTFGSASGTCPSDGLIGTSYYTNQTICVLGSADDDTDEYDDHVLIHEWGHYFEDQFSRSDSVGGPHGGGDRLDMRVAFGEGFGNAWSGIVTDNPSYRDSSGTRQASGFEINVENNSITNPGWYSEGSVQSLIYDLYDANPDGADNVALGLAPLYAVLRGEQRSGVPLTSIFSFISALKTANPASAAAINAVVSAQNIVAGTIDRYGSTETNDAGDADALPVYSPLTLGGSVNLCSGSSFGDYNKLGNRRFLRFTANNAGSHTFTATGTGADAVLVLHRAGVIAGIDSRPPPTETLTATLSPGDYVLEVAEFINIDENPDSGRSCFDISVSR